MGGGIEIDGTMIVDHAVEVGLIIEKVLGGVQGGVGREKEVEAGARAIN